MASATCKHCSKPLLEGRAYELSGHRWHVDCFRCSRCDTLLDADTNMLVLGDGTLVCNNCSYYCAQCHKKIEDMAILTNDQAFCSSCFTCRNCHRRIEDLKYARTSQGIFCMDCHASLLERKQRRKAVPSRTNGDSGMNGDSGSNGILKDASTASLATQTVKAPDPTSNSAGRTGSTKGPNLGPYFGTANASRSESPLSLRKDASYSTLAKSPHSSTGTSTRSPVLLKEPHLSKESVQDSKDSFQPLKDSLASKDKVNDLTTKADLDKQLPDLPPSVELPEPLEFDLDFDLNAAMRHTSQGSVVSSHPNSHESSRTQSPIKPSSAPSSKYGSLSDSSRQLAPSALPEQPVDASRISGHPPTSAFSPTNPDSHKQTMAVTTPERSRPAMAVPVRSQLRPTSPARSWLSFRSPKNTTPRATGAPQTPQTPRSVPPRPPVPPVDRSLAEMTGLAAQTNHKRSLSDTTPMSPTQDISAQGVVTKCSVDHLATTRHMHTHQRSMGSVGSVGSVGTLARDDDSEALRAKIQELEASLAESEQLYGHKRVLQTEVAELEAHRTHLLEETTMLTSKNAQLLEMNNELTRQTIEKFGSQSLWGSQNPQPPNTSQDSTMSPSSSSTGIGGKDVPLVTVLEPTKSPQPQKSKRWPWRRQGKSSSSTNASSNAFSHLTNHTNANHNHLQPMPQAPPHFAVMADESQLNMLSGSRGSPSHASMLGELLSDRVAADSQPVPVIVQQCFAEVERRGLDVEGIYRKSGSKSQVDSIMDFFARHPDGISPEGTDVLNVDIHAVTGVVKQYLRHLGDPVIPFDHYDAFIAAGNSGSTQVLRKVVRNLPPHHSATLRAIAIHLAKVASHGDTNLMPGRNLAVVFAPTLARDPSGDREFSDMQARNDATLLLISSADTLADPADADPSPDSFNGPVSEDQLPPLPARPMTPAMMIGGENELL